MNPIQRKAPSRNCEKSYANYTSFKPYLRDDFNHNCGYCDADDHLFGGKSGFQIDHFKPKKYFPKDQLLYSNLVYSCPICNRNKWDKWEVDDGFVDPCESDYQARVSRDCDGAIIHDGSAQGKYIHKELGLGLKRHKITWLLRELEDLSAQLSAIMLAKMSDPDTEDPIKEQFRLYLEIQTQFNNYTMYRRSLT